MKHALTFRGQDHEVPAGYGRCTRCGALLQIEAWLEQSCPGYPPAVPTKEERYVDPV